ncbi:uncharacterized protein DSM5745_02093 [Aspergillus mulundensis]|uniref:Biogenesis of lysosome-related organelles complex 1 subunit 1 n=1 Tax=Aspergillus mulundensis TaxID=1810919 RepID=A0A3D8SX13_9EURO|nr:hypothetical protein DSM5745_02093 [Aspergillus mulundensis]RDW90318.1 hypothetical protein DSM5745_02093 [Aspergillus mulundensis]
MTTHHNPSPAEPTTTSPSNPNQPTLPDEHDPQKLATSAFTASLHSLGANYTSALVDRAQNLHSNSAALQKQEAQLAKHTEALRKQNDTWEKVADEGRNALKEIGDVQNWAELLERDLLVIEEVVGALESEDRDRELDEGNLDLGGGEWRGEDGDGDVGMDEDGGEGRRVDGNGDVITSINGNGKIYRDHEADDGKDKKGKGKQAAAERKGWFSWLW